MFEYIPYALFISCVYIFLKHLFFLPSYARLENGYDNIYIMLNNYLSIYLLSSSRVWVKERFFFLYFHSFLRLKELINEKRNENKTISVSSRQSGRRLLTALLFHSQEYHIPSLPHYHPPTPPVPITQPPYITSFHSTFSHNHQPFQLITLFT